MAYKIILTGGGTMGSVTPLLAVAEEIKRKDQQAEFFWLGTKNGPERKIVELYHIQFASIPAGKLRRYFSLKNFLDPFLITAGFFKAFWVILKVKPKMIMSAGGFVGVPVVWAGWVLHVPILVHQEDLRPGLANRLSAPFSKIITVTFPESLKFFPKGIVTGNPVRREIFLGDKERAFRNFGLEKELPTVLVLGGGTGALELNRIVAGAAAELVKLCQVIHITGGRMERFLPEVLGDKKIRYHQFDFLAEDLRDAYVAADLVVSRAGLGTLTELAGLGKPTILVPIPKSHQEDNAYYFRRNNAAMIMNQSEMTPDNFAASVAGLISNKVELENLSRNMRNSMKLGAAGAMAEEVLKLIKK